MSAFPTTIFRVRLQSFLRCGAWNRALKTRKVVGHAHRTEFANYGHSTVWHPISKDQWPPRQPVGARSTGEACLGVSGCLPAGDRLSRSLSMTCAAMERGQGACTRRAGAETTEDGPRSSGESSSEEASSDEESPSSKRSPETDESLTPDQWRALKEDWLSKLQPYHARDEFESRSMSRLCKDQLYRRARSLMEFVRQEGTPPTYPLMAAYLFLCVRAGDHAEVFAVHDWLTANQAVLDDGVLNNLIAGFCQTERWRESLGLLEDMKRVGGPSARTYHALIGAACSRGERGLAEELVADLLERGLCPAEPTVLQLLRTFHCRTDDPEACTRSSRLVEGLLRYLREKRFYVSVDVGIELKNWFQSKKGELWRATMTRVTKSGKCHACGSVLESLDIGDEAFLNLQRQITEKVIMGGDVFKKTRPDELAAFVAFVNEGGPYDVIIDGLNVAHIKQNNLPSKMLRQFVVYLVQECGLKCLVLGRQHMLNYSRTWNRHHMDAIQDLADCFFTENVSQDDPFMLYATLHSGSKACYVSRDMLRDHKALLDEDAHLAFVRWQRGHQMYPLGFQNGRAVFKEKIAYDTVTQGYGSSWHIVCDDGSPRYSYQVPLDWLCARRVK